MRTTSRPWLSTPEAKAAASVGELSRMSWPIATRRAPSPRISSAKAAPKAVTSGSSISSPTSPRTS